MGNTKAETIARTCQSTFPVSEFTIKMVHRRSFIRSELTFPPSCREWGIRRVIFAGPGCGKEPRRVFQGRLRSGREGTIMDSGGTRYFRHIPQGASVKEE